MKTHLLELNYNNYFDEQLIVKYQRQMKEERIIQYANFLDGKVKIKNFDSLVKVYEFDKELRNLLFGFLKELELYFKNAFLSFLKNESFDINNNMYFRDTERHLDLVENILKCKNENQQQIIEKIQSLEFGKLVNIIRNMSPTYQTKYLKNYTNIKYRKNFGKHLFIVKEIRNIVAHHNLLFNITKIQIPDHIKTLYKEINCNNYEVGILGVYFYSLYLITPFTEWFDEFIKKVTYLNRGMATDLLFNVEHFTIICASAAHMLKQNSTFTQDFLWGTTKYSDIIFEGKKNDDFVTMTSHDLFLYKRLAKKVNVDEMDLEIAKLENLVATYGPKDKKIHFIFGGTKGEFITLHTKK